MLLFKLKKKSALNKQKTASTVASTARECLVPYETILLSLINIKQSTRLSEQNYCSSGLVCIFRELTDRIVRNWRGFNYSISKETGRPLSHGFPLASCTYALSSLTGGFLSAIFQSGSNPSRQRARWGFFPLHSTHRETKGERGGDLGNFLGNSFQPSRKLFNSFVASLPFSLGWML